MWGSAMTYDLKLVNPEFSSALTGIIIELDHMRKRKLSGSAAPWYFYQLKHIFHWLESLGSARIEGNHTTIADYIEHEIDGDAGSTESLLEIENIAEAIKYVEAVVEKDFEITTRFIFDLHSIIVKGLDREGDKNAGAYRKHNVTIAGANHIPPEHLHVRELIDELLAFIKKDDLDQYDLIKTALFHHRFTWIHPFGNGNGRVVRMLNYALLIKYGFNVKEGRIINPSCVFFNNRQHYYLNLSHADEGSDKALLQWCTYVLSGIKSEISRIDALLNYHYLNRHILSPAIIEAQERKLITKDEADILRLGIKNESQSFKASDISHKYNSRQKTHIIKGSRTYYVNFSRTYLLRGVMRALEKNHFITK